MVVLAQIMACWRTQISSEAGDMAAMRIVRKLLLLLVVVVAAFAGTFVAATWAPEKPVDDLKARWARPPSIFVEVGGMMVHVRDEGPRNDPSPIVFLHGTGSSLYAWDGWAETLKQKRRVIRYDLAGFGLTGPTLDGIYNTGRDVEMLIGLLDKLGVQRSVIGGNSLGGSIAWRTALAHPDRVEKLILVDSGGYPSHATSVPIGFRLAGLPGVGWITQHTLPRILVEQGYRNVFGDPNKVTAEMIERSVELTQRAGNRGALIARFRQRRRNTDIARIGEIKIPTLIIWGVRDRLIPPDDAERFHHDIPGSTLVMFDDLGHAPEEEDPARTVGAVETFLGLQ
jgi:pimeloyl-ACP methyl ester carboxylesterase